MDLPMSLDFNELYARLNKQVWQVLDPYDHIHEVLGKVIIGYSRKFHMKGGGRSR